MSFEPGSMISVDAPEAAQGLLRAWLMLCANPNTNLNIEGLEWAHPANTAFERELIRSV